MDKMTPEEYSNSPLTETFHGKSPAKRRSRVIAAAALFSLAVCFAGTALSAEPPGKPAFIKRCAWCHGDDGAGDGATARFLNPPPRDLTAGVFKWKSTPFDEPMPSDDDLLAIISGHDTGADWLGLAGTGMPGWSDTLGKDEIKTMVEYVKTLGALDAPRKPSISLSGEIRATSETLARGKELFKDRCAECHGTDGRGDGTKRLKDDWGGRTWPRDLTKPWTFRAGSGIKDIYTRITVGIPGTQMPSFADTRSTKLLSDKDRWTLAAYAASLAEPAKKPDAASVVRAMRIAQDSPSSPDAEVWSKTEAASFNLTPQLIEETRLFNSTLDSISVKAVYNDRDISILLVWDDRTRSLPGDAKAQGLAAGDLYPDGVAIQLPAALPRDGDNALPYFGMGGADAVNIWFWQSEEGAGQPQTLRLLEARGSRNIREADADKLGATGSYDKGVWRVVFKRPLNGRLAFEESRFIPVAFAAWDGSNAEHGSRHTMTPWVWLRLEQPASKTAYLWPLGAGALIFAMEWLLLKSRKD